MKTLKGIVIGLAVLISLLLIVALVAEKEYYVEREIVIAKPHMEVFDYVKYLKNQDNFSKWAQMDPAMQKSYLGTDGSVGFISKWESENPDVGKGEQEIVNIEEGSRIDYELRFIDPMESTSPAYITTQPLGSGQTKVTWGLSGKMKYPMNLMLLVMDFEKILGDDLQIGLTNLKGLMEG